MKRFLFTLLFFALTFITHSQNNFEGNLKIVPSTNGQTKIIWTNSFKKVKQISLQRSADNNGYFTTVYSPSNTNLKNYSFTDYYPIASYDVYYRLLFVNDKSEVLFSKPFSRSINKEYSYILMAGNTNLQGDETPNNTTTAPKKVESIIVKKQEPSTPSKEIIVADQTDDVVKPNNNAEMFKGTKSKMPDTYVLQEAPKKKSNKKYAQDEEVENELNSKNKKQRKEIINQIIAQKKQKDSTATTKLQENKRQNKPKQEKIIIENKVEVKKTTTTKVNNDDDVVVVATPKKKKVVKDSTSSNNTIETKTAQVKQDSSKKVEQSKTIVNTGIYGVPGKLIGKILNAKTGDGISSATVTIEGGQTKRTTKADYNGAFSFSNIPSGVYTISGTSVGFAKKLIDVTVIKDDVVTQDIVLNDSKTSRLDDVEVKSTGGGKRNVETINALLIQQKNLASVSDGISAEAIKRTPDRNTSDILKRVSGASIQDDKFAIIRGLNDRYNAVFLNSAPLPSTESDRKAFSFDIFPANMLDNLTIVKTATPDMPGEFAGGLIFINTKDIPTKDFQSVTFGLGFNTQATFQNRKYYKGGRWDFLGIDDGTRALSPNIPGANQLPSNLNEAAQKNYAKNIPNNWRNFEGVAPMNINFQYVKGLNIQRKGNDYLGVLLAATYSRSYNRTFGDRDSYTYDRGNPSQEPQQGAAFLDNNFSSQILAGFMANVSLKINNNNRISFKNIVSVNTDDRVITRTGTADFTNEPERLSLSSVNWFTSNVISSSQLLGEHFIIKPKLKVNWMGSYTSVNRQIPNLRRLSSYLDPIDNKIKQDIPDVTLSPDNGGTMFFANTSEYLRSAKLDIERKFTFNNRFNFTIKAGSFLQNRNRNFEARYLGLRKLNTGTIKFDQSLLELDETKIFDSKNMGVLKTGKGGFLLTEDFKHSNTYDAGSNLLANYLMVDARLFKFLRINGGLRIETFTQKLSYKEDGLGTPKYLDSTVTDFLPSVNLIFSLNSKQNLRFCYSKTLNRPEYRELANFIFYDYSTRLSVYGNPNIQRATITNYDIRYEIYPGKGQLFSVSGFYKKIMNPIELVLDPNIDATARYQNTPEADVYGAELEARIQLSSIFKKSNNPIWERLTVFGNVALIKSEIKLGKDTILYGPNRPLQGQSPNLYNTGIIYQHPNGFSATAQANFVGQRIFVAGNSNDMNIFENGRTVIDLQFAKVLEKQNLEFKLNIKDLLAQKLVYFFDVNSNNKYETDNGKNNNSETDKIFSTVNFGRVISASITYKF